MFPKHFPELQTIGKDSGDDDPARPHQNEHFLRESLLSIKTTKHTFSF
jgi:hypothetical protein